MKQEILTQDAEFESILRSVDVVAATGVNVLIQGESGTGKELLVRRIHDNSHFSRAKLVSLNCASLPESLAESELFGHCRGTFTGADKAYAGRIESARDGTLFLDEIAELPLSVQAKLLRFLELGECQKLGSTQIKKCPTRVVAASHEDLANRVEQGLFREDLFYRLNIIHIKVPPLRQRRGDVQLLLDHFTSVFAHQHQLKAPVYDCSAVNALKQYAWPGNVRELKNFSERMLIFQSGKIVRDDIVNSHLHTTVKKRVIGTHSPIELPEHGLNWNEMEKSLLMSAIKREQGNQSAAARLLGLSRDAFLYRMKKHHLL
ncbi:MAG: sigma 54-interacting transcriptional regulator [bacterium]